MVPLRADQRRMWLLEQLQPESSLFGLGFAVRIRPYDRESMQQALAELVIRHPALRTAITVVGAEPVHSVGSVGPPDLRIESWRRGSETELRERVGRFVGEPFDLRVGPPARFLLLEVAEGEVILVAAVHHVVSDMWSMALLGAEIADLLHSTEPKRRPRRQRSFLSFVEAEHNMLASDHGRRSVDFWRQELPEQWPALDLAPMAQGAGRTGPAGRHIERVPSEDLERWQCFAEQRGSNLHDLVLAGYFALVRRYTGQSDLLIGTYRANRSTRDMGSVGCYRNILALSTEVDGQAGLATLLEQVKGAVFRSRPHRRVSLPAVVEEIRGPGSVGDVNLPIAYQWIKSTRRLDPHLLAAFARVGRLTKGDGRRIEVNGLEVEALDFGSTTDADLTLEVFRHDDGLDLSLVYRKDRLETATVRRMGTHLRRILSSGVTNPNAPIAGLPMLSPIEEAEQVATARSPAVDHGRSTTVVGLVDARLAAHPDDIVVRAGDQTLTGRELDATADTIARRLGAIGVRPGDRVGIHLDPGPHLPPLLLATLRLGAAYVALGPDVPEQRLRLLIEAAGIGVVVTDRPALPRPSPEDKAEPVSWVSIDGLVGGEGGGQSADDRARAFGPGDLVYISFTSGSTGRPKPVGVTNANAVNYLLAVARRPGFGPGDTILAATALGFDISFTELFLPLVAGGTTVVAPRHLIAEARALAKLIETSGVNVVQTTPAVWRLLIDGGLAPRETLRGWCGGEHMGQDLADRLAKVCGEAWNVYGPTEATVWCSAWQVEPGRPVSIGDPLDNLSLYVLGPGGRPQPPGAVGELHIGGAGVTPGYLGRPEQTEAACLPDPFGEDGSRMYRTGDLVIRAEDGRIHFLGRSDHQIKLNGQRIEPGEIEAVLTSGTPVRAAAVIVRDGQLVAFVESDEPIDVVAIRQELVRHLPVSMVPGRIEPVDRLPLTTAKKVDRIALQHRPLIPQPVPFVPPQPGIERQLANLMADAIGVELVGRNDNFFDLGGDSLAAAALFADIRDLTDQDFPLVALFQGPTVAELAEVIGSGWRPSFTSLVEVKPQGSRRPFFSVSPFLISSLSYRLLADRLDPEQPLYAIQPQGLEPDDPVHDRIEEMAAHYIAELRTVQPEGPYRIGGHCAGSVVAFEMALQLQRDGNDVELLALVDSPPPIVDRLEPRRLQHLVHIIVHYWRSGRLGPALAWQLGLLRQRLAGRWSNDPAQRRIAAVREAHRTAHERYHPAERFKGSAVLLRSQESTERADRDSHIGWQVLIDGELLVAVVPGTHATLMLEDENTTVLAAYLTAVFDRLDRDEPLSFEQVGDISDADPGGPQVATRITLSL